MERMKGRPTSRLHTTETQGHSSQAEQPEPPLKGPPLLEKSKVQKRILAR
jgi:hypothetical protein